MGGSWGHLPEAFLCLAGTWWPGHTAGDRGEFSGGVQGLLWDFLGRSSRGAYGLSPQWMSFCIGMYGIFHNHIQWPRVLSQCWHSMGLGVHEGLACKSNGVSVLGDAGSKPLEWGITLEGDWFGLIIVSQGSEEGFLQLGLNFLEAHVGVFIPGKAVLLFEEGPEGLSVQAEMRNEMSVGNLLLLRNNCSSCFIWGGVISEMPWIFSGSGEYPSAEKTLPKNVTDSCFMAHFLLLKMSPSFWATLNKFMMFALWSLSFFP